MNTSPKLRFRKIYIQITNLCNLNCTFCNTLLEKPRFLSVTHFEEILQRISGYTSHLYLHVTGEPLMHPQLIELLDLCRKYKYLVILVTNGVLLGQKAERILSHRAIKQINISLHCYHEIQNPAIKSNYLATLFSFLKLVRTSHAIISLRLWNMPPEQTADWLQINHPIVEAIEKNFATSIPQPLQIHGRDGIQLEERIWLNFDYRFEWPSLNHPEIFPVGKCLGLRDHIAILTDGTVVPCCIDSVGIINLGNIFQSSLSEILESPRAIRIIEGFKRAQRVEPLCRRCNFYR